MHRKVYTTSTSCSTLLIHSHTHIYIHTRKDRELIRGKIISDCSSFKRGISSRESKDSWGTAQEKRTSRGDRSGERKVVGSSPRHERLASVSFGRNTDRLSKRHEATAKTNLKCLLTKQSELAALPAHEEAGCSRRLLLSMAIILHGSLRYRSCPKERGEGAHPRAFLPFSSTSCLPLLLISVTKIEPGDSRFEFQKQGFFHG